MTRSQVPSEVGPEHLAGLVGVGGEDQLPLVRRAEGLHLTGVGAAAHRAAGSKAVLAAGGAAAALGALGALFLGAVLRT